MAASQLKFQKLGSLIVAKKQELPDEVWQKGIQKYNFCYNQASQRLTKKLKNLSNLNSLEILLPHRCLATMSSFQMEESDSFELPPVGSQMVVSSPQPEPSTSSKIFFTPDMITPIPYDPENFKPICIDEVNVPESLMQLCSYSPSFSPTPPKTCPPEGYNLHQALVAFKKRFGWTYCHRKKELRESESVEDFVTKEFELFVKEPWYVPSTREPPPLPPTLESAFESLYRSIMDPSNWNRYHANLSIPLREALKQAKLLPSINIGIYMQDKSARICFADLEKTNLKVDQVLSDTNKYVFL